MEKRLHTLLSISGLVVSGMFFCFISHADCLVEPYNHRINCGVGACALDDYNHVVECASTPGGQCMVDPYFHKVTCGGGPCVLDDYHHVVKCAAAPNNLACIVLLPTATVACGIPIKP